MDVEDEWEPSHEKLRIIEINASDEMLIHGLKSEKGMPEFYDPIKDLKYEKWAQGRYGKISKVLSCPGCFTTVAYDCSPEGQNFVAKTTFNTTISESVQKAEGGEIFLTILCEVCDCELGILDPETHWNHLFHVLEDS